MSSKRGEGSVAEAGVQTMPVIDYHHVTMSITYSLDIDQEDQINARDMSISKLSLSESMAVVSMCRSFKSL